MSIKDRLEKAINFVVGSIIFVGKIVLIPFEELSDIIRSFKFPKKKKRKRKKVKKKPKVKRKKDIKKINSFLFGILFSFMFLFFPFQIYGWYKALPRPELLSQITNKSTKILDKEGRLLYEIYVDKNYDPVKLSQIPEDMINATLAIEDASFYDHFGVSIPGMVRAIKATILEGGLQGGSTITQQLVKNVLLNPERTISRKTKEIITSFMVEGTYSKEEILEMYLNNISYGGTSWGIQSASVRFFGKSVWDLNLAEAAFLAGLPSAPTTFSPFSGGIDSSKERQKQVLNRMVEIGYITEEDAASAFGTDLVFAPQKEFIRAPHFVNFVRDELERIYGTRLVNLGGLTVVTTLDLDLQDVVQEIVATEVENNAHLNFSNGAAVVLEPKTGEILAYVGSIDFFNAEIDGQVDIVTSFRQPGSSIKPVTYALAFESGFTPASVIEDKEITFNFPNQPPYTPVNYDNEFHGKVTLRDALANSYNVPAVKLANTLGPDNIVGLGKDLGLTGWEVDDSYGVSITLGGKEVRLLDLTNVFATFARNGTYLKPTPIKQVWDANGYSIYSDNRREREVVSPEVSYIISHILSDNKAREPAFGPSSWLVIFNHQVAVKTGTTDAKRDNWTIGYTPSYAVGTWVGNNDNTPMHPFLSSGLSGASPIWNKITNHILLDKPSEPFKIPDNVFVKVDSKCDNKREVFIRGTAPTNLCDLPKKD